MFELTPLNTILMAGVFVVVMVIFAVCIRRELK